MKNTVTLATGLARYDCWQNSGMNVMGAAKSFLMELKAFSPCLVLLTGSKLVAGWAIGSNTKETNTVIL